MERFGNDVDVIWGCTIDDTLGEKVKVTLLATGFNIDSSILTRTTTQAPQPTVVVRPESDIISEVYGTSAEDRVFIENVRSSYILFSMEEMDDDAFIEKVMKTPAYSRPSNFKQQLRETDSALNVGESQPKSNTNPIIF
jgi:cell division protein FtsZ